MRHLTSRAFDVNLDNLDVNMDNLDVNLDNLDVNLDNLDVQRSVWNSSIPPNDSILVKEIFECI
jgi:hypothetical protein